VIHEHDELLLASAAIDFGLSDEEAERLRQAIHDCPVCAQRASAYRRQFQLLAELPVLEPSDVVRRRVLGAVATGRVRQSRSPMFLLLAAALVIGATLALVAVVAGGALFRPKTIAEFPPVDQSVGPGPSAVARASERGVLPSQPADPSSGGPPTAIAVDSVAEVISTNLRLRSQPRIAADSIKFEPFLDVGDRLFVVDGPVVATDHDWYQVKVWRPSDPGATWPIGWVASADINGTPWIAAATLACPPGPGVDQLAAMNRYEALACYGRRTITFRGLVGSSEPVALMTISTSERCCLKFAKSMTLLSKTKSFSSAESSSSACDRVRLLMRILPTRLLTSASAVSRAISPAPSTITERPCSDPNVSTANSTAARLTETAPAWIAVSVYVFFPIFSARCRSWLMTFPAEPFSRALM